MAHLTATLALDMSGADYLNPGFNQYIQANSSTIAVQYTNQHYGVFNSDPAHPFVYDAQGNLTGGTVVKYQELMPDGHTVHVTIDGLAVSAVTVQQDIQHNQVLALNQLIFGGADSFTGSAGNDHLTAFTGNDTLHGGAGADTLDGGLALDTADYTGSAAVNVSLLTHLGAGGDAAGDSLIGIENLIGSAFGDTLIGDGGSNTLVGGAGGDSLDGGTGIDTADYSASAAAVQISLLAHTAAGGDAAGDTLTGIENLIGTKFADSLVGDGGNNVFHGGAGADSLSGGAGSDTADYGGSAAVSISLLAHTASGGHAAGDVLTSIENLTGGNQGDSLVGDAGNNILNGGTGGNDTLVGGAGNDFLHGGVGADSLVGGETNGLPGSDTADYDGSTAVSISLLAHTASGGDATGDTLVGIENLRGSYYSDSLVGDGGNNVLNGGTSGADTLDGGAGNDTLSGGPANDSLIGGAGDDRFLFQPSSGRDTIHDFAHGHDKLDVTAYHFAGVTAQQFVDAHMTMDGTNSYFNLDANTATHEITLLGVTNVDGTDVLI